MLAELFTKLHRTFYEILEGHAMEQVVENLEQRNNRLDFWGNLDPHHTVQCRSWNRGIFIL